MYGTGCSGNQDFGDASRGGREITPVHVGGPPAGRTPDPDGHPSSSPGGGSSAGSTARAPPADGRREGQRTPIFTRGEMGLTPTPSPECRMPSSTPSPEL